MCRQAKLYKVQRLDVFSQDIFPVEERECLGDAITIVAEETKRREEYAGSDIFYIVQGDVVVYVPNDEV